MSLGTVLAWRGALAADLAGAPDVGLSRPGLALVLDHALAALTDEALAAAVQRAGRPFPAAGFVAARTVVTAPIEWLAVLLGRGTRVVLKHPEGAPGLAPWLAAHARVLGLPLEVTPSRSALEELPLVIAMGRDDTVAALRAALPPTTRLLGFGARWSAAWWPRDADPAATARALALDLAAHDGRGCMSPALVLTDAPDVVAGALPRALDEAEARWPRGALTPAEHAGLRSRAALVQVVGRRTAGEGWQVHVVPPAHAVPVALPRVAQVVPIDGPEQAAAVLARWGGALSTLGVAGTTAPPALPGPTRTCLLGEMQRPPLLRLHDGMDVWGETLL